MEQDSINAKKRIYIVAEIGINHNGDIDIQILLMQLNLLAVMLLNFKDLLIKYIVRIF